MAINAYKMLKLFLVSIAFFLLCYCAGEQIGDAKSITAYFRLDHTLGENSALLTLQYSARPTANFTIEEVIVGNNQKLEGLPQKGEALAGCGGSTAMVILDLNEKQINFKKDQNTRLDIKTKWQGKSSQEMKDQFYLPSLSIESVSTQVSKDEPLKIAFSDGLSNLEWGSCSVEFVGAGSDVSVVFLSRKTDEMSLIEQEIRLDQIADAFAAKKVAMPKAFKGKIICSNTDIKTVLGSQENRLFYTLSSKEYDIAIK